MRNFCVFGLVFLYTILGVNSQSPLQIDPEEFFAKHSHGHGDSGESKAFSGNAKIRLPTNVLPVHYDLEIIPILDELDPPSSERERFTAPGKVKITVQVHEATDNIILHKHEILTIKDDLTVTSVTNPADPIVATFTLDESQELYIINLDKTLTVGQQYEISVSFVAPVDITGRNNGLYRSTYTDPVTKELSYIATTQFEAASARQAFPCFDEPGIKATFKIKIGYNKADYVALGNTGYIDGGETPLDEYGADWVLQEFEETVPMSSYLVAIVVANFEFEQAPEGIYGKPSRIYGAPHLMKNEAGDRTGGVFSATTSAKLLDFFEKHYEIEYHLSKMDSVAVVDFNFGAMENWGLNIYRQEYLLFHDGVSLENDRKRITSVLSHELAHQWFGNLVTTEWWSFIWLNEGFATYNEYLGAQMVEPNFQYEQVSVNENLQVALVSDALPSTHALVNSADPNDPNDLLMVYFDRITYQKGGAVILMMEAFLGKETFRRALINYLNGMAFQGVNQDHLFQFLTEQAHADNKISQDITMKDIMDTWTLQSGFPLVRVSRAGSSRIYISQERFTNGGPVTTPNELGPNDLWHIPVAMATADNPDFSNHTPAIWIEKDVILKSVNLDTSKWVMVNPDATGYYRVLYDTYLTNLIVEQLNTDFQVISDASRSQLIDDYFTLATEKYIQVETALQLTKYLTREPKMVVWTPVLKHMRVFLNKLSGNSPAFDDFRQYILPRITAALEIVGKEQSAGEQGWQVILRAQLLDWACSLGQTECREYALRLFNAWNDSPDTAPVPVDIRPVVFCGAVSHGGITTYQHVKGGYIREKDKDTEAAAKLRVILLNSFACTEDVFVADELFEEVMKTTPEAFLVPGDKGALLQRLAANAQTRPLLINFLREELTPLFTIVPPNGLASVVSALATYVGTKPELDAISELVNPMYDALWGEVVLTVVKGHIRTIEQNVAWRTEYDARLQEWFSSNK